MPKIQWHERDGADVYRHTIEDGRYYLEVKVGNRDDVFKFNHEMRAGGHQGRLSAVGDGQMSLNFASDAEINLLARKYPDLKHWDSEVRGKAWRKFMTSSESKPYRMRDKL